MMFSFHKHQTALAINGSNLKLSRIWQLTCKQTQGLTTAVVAIGWAVGKHAGRLVSAREDSKTSTMLKQAKTKKAKMLAALR